MTKDVIDMSKLMKDIAEIDQIRNEEMTMDTPIHPKSKSVRTINILENELELEIMKLQKIIELVQKLRKELYDKDEIIRALERESYD